MSYIDEVRELLTKTYDIFLPESRTAIHKNTAQAIAEIDRWVKVEDELPEDNQEELLLLYCPHLAELGWDIFQVGWYTSELWFHSEAYGDLKLGQITHWQDIAPPRKL